MSSNSEERLINGPLNVVRIEKGNRSIWLFMDYHQTVEKQTDCNSVWGKDIKEMFITQFKRLSSRDSVYHFFLEIDPSYDGDDTNNYKGRYSDELAKLVTKSFKVNDELVGRSRDFSSIKLHPVDIRGYLIGDTLEIIFALMAYVASRGFTVTLNDINKISQILDKIYSSIKGLYDIIYKSKDPDKDKIITKFLIEKILNDYRDDQTRSVIRGVINGMIKESFDQYFGLHEVLKKDLKRLTNNLSIPEDILSDYKVSEIGYGPSALITREIINDIITKIEKLNYLILAKISSKLMDLYMLRIIVNRDMKRSIVFTGIDHGIYSVYLLVKYFDFQITHACYLKDSIGNVTDTIKGSIDFRGIPKLFFPKVLRQCCDLSEFPEYFQ